MTNYANEDRRSAEIHAVVRAELAESDYATALAVAAKKARERSQSLPTAGTPSLSQLQCLDSIAAAAVTEFVRRENTEARGTGRYLLLGGLLGTGGPIAVELRFEVETYVETSKGSGFYEAKQEWIDANGRYAFDSPDAYLYADDEN